MEVLGKAEFVRLAALEGVQNQALFPCLCPAPAEEGKLGDGLNLAQVASCLYGSGELEHRLFSHSVA